MDLLIYYQIKFIQIEQTFKKKQNLKNSIESCETTADKWYIKYENSKYTATGSISPAEMNSCKEESLLFSSSRNLNYYIISASGYIANE